MSKYYKASPEVAEICQRIIDREQEIVHETCKISRRYGGSRTQVLTNRSLWGDLHVTGFKFTKEPDTKIFKKIKNCPGGWAPRRGTKKGKEIVKQLEGLVCTYFSELTDAIGMEVISSNLRVRRPGIYKKGDDWYLNVPDDVEPKGCERISDVEFERLAA